MLDQRIYEFTCAYLMASILFKKFHDSSHGTRFEYQAIWGEHWHVRNSCNGSRSLRSVQLINVGRTQYLFIMFYMSRKNRVWWETIIWALTSWSIERRDVTAGNTLCKISDNASSQEIDFTGIKCVVCLIWKRIYYTKPVMKFFQMLSSKLYIRANHV